MAQPMNIDLLRGACMAHGVSIEARGYNDLRIALGGVCVGRAGTLPGVRTWDLSVPAMLPNANVPCSIPGVGSCSFNHLYTLFKEFLDMGAFIDGIYQMRSITSLASGFFRTVYKFVG